MPRYDFNCLVCNFEEERWASFEERTATCPECGDKMVRQFPLSAIKGFQPFESYYDEGLGCDINGRRERQQVMKALNVIEAGDKVHGGRNFEANAPHHVKPQPPRGAKLEPRLPPQEWDVAVEKQPGELKRVQPKDIPSANR